MKSLLCLCLSALLLIPVVSATDVRFDPESFDIESGSIFNVTIWVLPTQMIDTVATNTISWDAGDLICLGVEHGNLFNETTIWLPGTIDNVKGAIFNSIWASSQPTSTSGTYIVLSFRAKSSTRIIIDMEGCGIARNGTDVPKTIQNTLSVNVGGSVLPDVVNDQMLFFVIVFCIVVFVLVILVLLSRRKKV